ncbi:MAG: DUF169 domain-containing protein [Desulforhopalus sp.]
MTNQYHDELKKFFDILGLIEEPVGIYFTDDKPAEGFSPKSMALPSREKEIKNEIDWQSTFANFSCVMGHVLRARKLKKPAYFSAEQFGCPGCAFWLGFTTPQTETIIQYVSTGIPGQMEGELYCDSPDELRRIQNDINPEPASGKFCVVKPLSLFTDDEQPELVAFFARPETLCGLHQLATFVTNDPEVVASPLGAACTNMITWPYKYLAMGKNRAVLGGWDPSARRFFSTDELTFTVPYGMFMQMRERFSESFLTTSTWTTVQKKIKRSNKAWTPKTNRGA